ncbi:MAG TPA: N-formylglutamate deformylase [Ramlibacter sp.]|uniref:N-formylglutamate deformylase n=1 Tax=Ramlibacter sp. TaxID=1917967 RepID=UPI002D7E5F56|nr:N-formylglutamate deformylase [Ramlibacter sp.]HET8745296.1 N-formylglutamate deformylase [Ramlibacter sp.]
MNQTHPPFLFHAGTAPLLVSMPHMGTYVPPEIAARLTDEARRVPDTDWHMDRLYAFARELGASVLMATHSRYVIDLNRPPDGSSLYPGRSVTGLCPVDTFDDQPLYRDGQEPDAAETQARIETWWRPYHAQLRAELQRIRQQHGVAMLWDAHSIRSVLPRFFEGRLTDFNLGTADGASCDPALGAELLEIARGVPEHSAVLNGRFKGGYITREYGRPAEGVHAVQLELTQCSYMEESGDFAYLPERAKRIQPYLRRMLETVLAHARRAAAAAS